MRKTKVMALATMAALAAGSMYVPAENTMKVRADAYLIIDLGKVLSEAEVADTEENAQDSTPFYLDLLQAEDTGVYDVTGSFVDEPFLHSFWHRMRHLQGLMQRASTRLPGILRRIWSSIP